MALNEALPFPVEKPGEGLPFPISVVVVLPFPADVPAAVTPTKKGVSGIFDKIGMAVVILVFLASLVGVGMGAFHLRIPYYGKVGTAPTAVEQPVAKKQEAAKVESKLMTDLNTLLGAYRAATRDMAQAKDEAGRRAALKEAEGAAAKIRTLIDGQEVGSLPPEFERFRLAR